MSDLCERVFHCRNLHLKSELVTEAILFIIYSMCSSYYDIEKSIEVVVLRTGLISLNTIEMIFESNFVFIVLLIQIHVIVGYCRPNKVKYLKGLV